MEKKYINANKETKNSGEYCTKKIETKWGVIGNILLFRNLYV